MAIESIAKTLGTGSGIDISALVSSLVDAQFANKTAAIGARDDRLSAQISKASELKSTISDFASALAALASGGSLATQPTSSNDAVLRVSRLAGAQLDGLSASIEVRQLARGQVASSAVFAGGGGTAMGPGTLTVRFGTASVADGGMAEFTPGSAAPVTIPIDAAHATLDGVAAAINAAGAGVTASIVQDASGARLVVKGGTGATQAFELRGTGDLAQLDIGVGAGGSTIAAEAQDAQLTLDGVAARYPSNSIYGLIDGVRIELASAAPGTSITLGTSFPESAIRQTVANFVDTYNQVYALVKAAVDPVDGPLRGDGAAKALLRALKGLTLAPVGPAGAAGAPTTLADLGVATGRDGTLSLDSARLATVLAAHPASVEAMFAPGAGLPAALAAIAETAADRTSGLGASEAGYARAQADLGEDREALAAAAEKAQARLTQQFAAMDAKVAAYKATQGFLAQQIASWNAER